MLGTLFLRGFIISQQYMFKRKRMTGALFADLIRNYFHPSIRSKCREHLSMRYFAETLQCSSPYFNHSRSVLFTRPPHEWFLPHWTTQILWIKYFKSLKSWNMRCSNGYCQPQRFFFTLPKRWNICIPRHGDNVEIF